MTHAVRLVLTALLIGFASQAGGTAVAAGLPTMPLSEVREGMRCEARSVLQGVDVSTFTATVVSLVDSGTVEISGDSGLVLVRVSGPGVDGVGIGPGFSGSPILCPGADGALRVIGAIGYSLGSGDPQLALVTPIARMLGQSLRPPIGARPLAPALGTPRRLAPLPTVSGLSTTAQRWVVAALARRKRSALVAPAAPVARFSPRPLVPGSSLAVGLARGDLQLGAVGVVSYVDGARIWGFGHPYENAGRRALLLQDAWVYDVVGSPIDLSPIGVSTYKLAAPAHTLGTITADGSAAVGGTTGALPPLVPLRVRVRDDDTGRVGVRTAEAVDEFAAGPPKATSATSSALPLLWLDGFSRALASIPPRQSLRSCLRIRLRGIRRPFGYCNRYVGDGGAGEEQSLGAAPSVLFTDLQEALAELDAYRLGRVEIVDAKVETTVRRGLEQAFLIAARIPRRVRAGRIVPVSLRLQAADGRRAWRRVRMRVPRETEPGVHELTLAGAPLDVADDGGFTLDLGEEDPDEAAGAPGARSLAAVGRRIAALERWDGVRARLGDGAPLRLYRADDLRISGRAVVHVRVLAAR